MGKGGQVIKRVLATGSPEANLKPFPFSWLRLATYEMTELRLLPSGEP